MESAWNAALWRQFGAAIDMLDNALVACPSSLWRERLWQDPPGHPLPPWFPPEFAEFWHVGYHALFWLDLYLSGSPEEAFTPPAPFTWTELYPVAVSPERPYTKEELRAYLATTRRKCQATLVALTDERAGQPVEYSWAAGQAVGYLELQLYNLRHVQEHAAQLSLFLGQRAGAAAPDWVPLAKEAPGSQRPPEPPTSEEQPR
jgi:hypothetical protein